MMDKVMIKVELVKEWVAKSEPSFAKFATKITLKRAILIDTPANVAMIFFKFNFFGAVIFKVIEANGSNMRNLGLIIFLENPSLPIFTIAIMSEVIFF